MDSISLIRVIPGALVGFFGAFVLLFGAPTSLMIRQITLGLGACVLGILLLLAAKYITGVSFAIWLAFIGAFMLLFLTPVFIWTGYTPTGAGLGVLGLVLMLITILLFKVPAVPLYAIVGVTAVGFLVLYGFTVPGLKMLPDETKVTLEGVTTIEDAIQKSRDTKLSGIELVAYVQDLTARKFTYSRRNPWDSPARSFERGMGYCQQQALALKEIFDGLGIEYEVVQAAKNMFPPAEIHGVREPGGISGHVWLRVKVDGDVLDVDPLDRNNRPGIVNFETLSEVTGFPPVMRPFMNLGSVMSNIIRDMKARRATSV